MIIYVEEVDPLIVFEFGNSVYYICTSGGPAHIYTMIYDFQKGVG